MHGPCKTRCCELDKQEVCSCRKECIQFYNQILRWRFNCVHKFNLAALLMLLLLLCLSAAANFNIVVSQDVVTVAQLLYLNCMHVLVETSINFMLLAIHTEASACISLVPRFFCIGGEKEPGIHCLRMYQIAPEFWRDRELLQYVYM